MSKWITIRLDECTQIVSGGTPSTSEPSYWDGDICWATPKDLSELQNPYITDTPRKITHRGLESCAAVVLPPESVLFSSRAPIGHVAINTVPMATNQGFKSLIPNRNQVHAKFLYHWLRKNRPYLESLGNGATFKEVSKAVVSRIEIPLPPLLEQRRIAQILDKADALRAKRRAALAHLDALAQAIFLDMFGDPATNPRGFRRASIGSCVDNISTWNPGTKPEIEFRYIDISAIDQEKKAITMARSALGKEAPSRARQVVQFDDVLVSTVRPNLNAVARVPSELDGAMASTGFCVLRPSKDKLVSPYLFALVRSRPFIVAMARQATGASYPAVTECIVRAWMAPVPPVELQNLYAVRINHIGQLQSIYEVSLSELDVLFASLQHRAFRGEL